MGGRGGLVAGGGVGALILGLIAMFLGVDPRSMTQGGPSGQPGAASAGVDSLPASDELGHFVRQVLTSTDRTWDAKFQQMGQTYEHPTLVLFSGGTDSGCGFAQSAVGPFYCPRDHKVYIDLSFYDDLKQRFSAPGDFAEAYVIAHEVGHHVQNLTGISDKVSAAEQRGTKEQANALSVRLELQADCFAGVWAKNNQEFTLQPGDVEEGLNAASAIGDDRLQKEAQGYVVPESFTHGSSAQRVRWFQQGYGSGDMNQCDTFNARDL
jgi:predicted metalloprotease